MVAIYTLLSVLAVSLVSLIGVITLSLREKILRSMISFLVSFAVGALLGDAFIHLIPESFEHYGGSSLFIIFGILLFFSLEQYFHWHHLHGEEFEDTKEFEMEIPKLHIHPVGYIVLVSDSLHNFLDGLIISASYFVSIPVGIATTVAVIIHEIPQEIGDFGILIHSNFSKGKALFYNFISALFALVGAGAGLLLKGASASFIDFIVPIAAGGFIYIAGSDLIPELHKTRSLRRSLVNVLVILLGVSLMYLLIFLE
jgi:zinc and cadmium transporter